MPKYLITIVGPTAIGKTSLSIQLAKNLKTEIISADSRQFYKEIPIGTAQPTQKEMSGIPHHFISFLSIQDTYTAFQFAKESLEMLNNIFTYQDVVILTGGSGLYIQALCEGLIELPSISPQVRTMLNTTFERKGLAYLTALLAQKDPDYYRTVDLNNPKRVIRALEICLGIGMPYSILRKQLPKEKRNFHLIKIGLVQENILLHERIHCRVNSMIEQGLLDEATKLYPYRDRNALQTIGYKELFSYIDKQYSLDTAITLIKSNTKKYAKKQLTWFKKDQNIQWFAPYDLSKITTHILDLIQKFQATAK